MRGTRMPGVGGHLAGCRVHFVDDMLDEIFRHRAAKNFVLALQKRQLGVRADRQALRRKEEREHFLPESRIVGLALRQAASDASEEHSDPAEMFENLMTVQSPRKGMP